MYFPQAQAGKSAFYVPSTMWLIVRTKSDPRAVAGQVRAIIREIELTAAIARLQTMSEVGLHYLTLGQPLNTLSGGECQRIKLASELHKEGSIYVMDEPTTGLHKSDTAHLLEMINRLVDRGNTVIVIEHNLDVIRHADWIIDMGPEGGDGGGQIVVEGGPEDVARHAGSHTGRYLAEVL